MYKRKEIQPGYEIDTLGNVFSCWKFFGRNKGWGLGRSWHILKQTKTNRLGYLRTKLRSKTHLIHQLVAKAFLPRVTGSTMVCHRDSNPLNNSVENLYWGTNTSNMRDAAILGRLGLNGERNNNAKLNKFQVQRIRLLKEVMPTISFNRIAKMFNVSNVLIRQIIKRKIWAHV